jgi:hypothetical protein
MNDGTTNWLFSQTILCILGGLVILKSTWAFMSPASFRKTCKWWAGMTAQVGWMMGWICILLAALLYCALFLDAPWVERLIAVFGLLYAAAASLFFKPQGLIHLMDRLVVNRSDLAVRLIFLLFMLLGVLLVFIAIKNP